MVGNQPNEATNVGDRDNQMTRRTRLTRTRQAGPNHAVLTVKTKGNGSYCYRREPCVECPWRKDSKIGAFPAEAYRLSATTAYDMANNIFACHMSGSERPATCAGFLLRGAAHNLSIRMRQAKEDLDLDSVHSDVDLYDSYREMAEANGVSPDDPVLKPCR